MLKRELNTKIAGYGWLLLLWLLTQEEIFKFSVWSEQTGIKRCAVTESC